MRKGIAIILCLAMMAGIMACGQNKQDAGTDNGTMTENSEENVNADAGSGELSGTLSILGWYSDEVAQGWIDHFNSIYPDVKVEYQYAQAGLGEDPKTWGELVDAMHALENLDGITPFVNYVTDATLTIETPLYGATWMSTEPDYEKKIESGEKTYADYWEPIFEITKRDLYDSGLMTEELAGMPWDSVVNNFALGKVGMIVGASWNFADIEAINPDLNYKIMGIPNEDGTAKYYLGDCLEPSLAVMESSENKEIALAFLESLFDEESLRSNEEKVGLIGCVDGYDSLYSDNPICADALVEGMQTGHQFMPQTHWRKNVERMRAKYVENIQAMLLTGKSPAECAADFDDIYQAE